MPTMDIEIWISGILVLFIIFKNVSHSSLGCSTKAGAGGSLLAFRLELHSWNWKLQRTKQARTLKSKNTAVGHARAPWVWTWYALTSVRNGAALCWRGLAYGKCGLRPSGFVEGHKRKQGLLTGSDSVRSWPTFSYYFSNVFLLRYHLSLFHWLTHLLSETFSLSLLSFWTQALRLC